MKLEKALTFDDILLVPKYSEVVPSEVQTKSFFTKDITLSLPVLSAAMDTVTENETARVMAQNGGLGIIHKNMSIKSQSKEVVKVKKYESGMIKDPFTLGPKDKIQEAIDLMQKYSFSGLPVVDEKNKLIGILTDRDLRFHTDGQKAIETAMTKENLVTAFENIKMSEAKKILHKYRIEKLPVIDDNGFLKGLITIKDIKKAEQFPMSAKDSQGRLLVGAAIGVRDEDRERADVLAKAEVDILVIDTAHGHSKNVLEMTEFIKKKYPHICVVAGNVATGEACEALFSKGADVVKVGIGPGSICTTRIVSGVGVPQVYALNECVKVARKFNKSVIADGGIRYSGDVSKALALGANAVMVGSLIAGCDETPGELVIYQGKTYKLYRGMGSLGAMKKGSKDRYFQSNTKRDKDLIPEGVEGRVAYKGSLNEVLYQLQGGVKAGMAYLGASDIKELQEKAHFIKVSFQAHKESHVHGIHITKESPNYRL